MVSDIDKLYYYKKWYEDPASFFVDIYKIPYNVQSAHPYQAKIMNMMKDLTNDRLLILAAGTTGKTITLGALALWHSVVLARHLKRRWDTVIISGSDEQSRGLYEYSKTVLETHPILADEVMGEIRVTKTQFRDRSTIMALPNSVKAIQGKHAPFVIVDEAALAGDFVINDTKRIIGAFEPNRVILSGTPMGFEQGATGEQFIEMYEDKEKYPEWKRISWSAFDCPSISDKMRKEAESLPEREYQVYWLGKPYASTNIMIPRENIRDAMVSKVKYNPYTRVYIGVDWGHAHPTGVVIAQLTKDNVFQILETGFFKGETFEDIHNWIEAKARYYKAYRIYTDGSDVGENQRLMARHLPVFPIQFNKEKGFMQSRLRDLFLNNQIEIPENEQTLIQQLKTYTWNKKINDDLVDALQLCVKEDAKSTAQIYYKITKRRR